MSFSKPEADLDLHGTHQWLRIPKLKVETEGFVVVTQDQSLFTRHFQANIFYNEAERRCRFCNTSTETLNHLISGPSILALNEYTNRHNRVVEYINWKMCNYYDIEAPNKMCENEPLPVVNTQKVTILWDFPIRNNRTI